MLLNDQLFNKTKIKESKTNALPKYVLLSKPDRNTHKTHRGIEKKITPESMFTLKECRVLINGEYLF